MRPRSRRMIGVKRHKIVAQRQCTDRLKKDWENRLPSSARRVVTPHMPNKPGAIVYSLGGLGDDSQEVRSPFRRRRLPGWEQIRRLIDTVPLMTGSDPPATRRRLRRRSP